MSESCIKMWLRFFVLGLVVSVVTADQRRPQYRQVKVAAFTDPNTHYLYRVASHNVTVMTTDSTYRSIIRVSRVRLDERDSPLGEPEYVQTINFHPSLVDFDLHCLPTHCYMVVVTTKTRKNVELYSWQRTQFDLLARRDSYSKPYAVRLFRIHSGFYIAIAQNQLHLSSMRLAQEYEEPSRFIGCAILKFLRGKEQNLRYHQFIKLPFNPPYVEYFTSVNPNNITLYQPGKPTENHYLVFSTEKNWQEVGSNAVSSYIWSPLNDHFWPYRLPRNVSVAPIPQGYQNPVLLFPTYSPSDVTKGGNSIEPVESCFHQLQRLLADREIHGRKLIESSNSLWRTQHSNDSPISALTNITARVIVHGNVIVSGSMIESPQMSFIGRKAPSTIVDTIPHSHLLDASSPMIVENRLKQAKYKLDYVRSKLLKAVQAYSTDYRFNSRVRFFSNINAHNIIFRNGLSNSNVRLNGIPFYQLERELVSLQGVQDVAAKVMFTGNVHADMLEIHGTINAEGYRLYDAIDITSKRVQIIDTGISNALPGQSSSASIVQFDSVNVTELILTPNATINDISLKDFITKDSRDQFIFGRKSFKNLAMGRLDLANPQVHLNEFSIGRMASKAIRRLTNVPQVITGKLIFTSPIKVNKLIMNNLINRRVDLNSLINDSVKSNEVAVQHISGHKRFLQGLDIAHLSTDGSINGVNIGQIFNLNPYPPPPDYTKSINSSMFYSQPSITGTFTFTGNVDIVADLNAQLINGVDVSRRAVRRNPPTEFNSTYNRSSPQIVHGHKIFMRPLRVLDAIRLINNQQFAGHTPTINGIDFRLITEGIRRQKQNPTVMRIDNLDIEGNLILDSSSSGPSNTRATFGNFTFCSLNSIRSRVLLEGLEEQSLDVPLKIDSLRARTAYMDAGALNDLSFPEDFILRSDPNSMSHKPVTDGPVESIFGRKSFEHISVAPLLDSNAHMPQQIVFGPLSSINDISFDELRTYVNQERQRNSTGETVIQTLNVMGNLYAKRINGNYWPEDILLKSVGSIGGVAPSPYLHRRIYSPLVFLNSSYLEIENQLVLRGPIRLGGRMNSINLTEFSRQSVTYGDKDLLSVARPIRNKIFLGGLSVLGEIRSQGLVDGVNIEEMRRRVVTIRPFENSKHVTAQKIFMSDVSFLAPTSISHLNDLPIYDHLKKIQFLPPNGNQILITRKKTITGSLIINKALTVMGFINDIDFVDLKAKAIPLSSRRNEVKFNKTLTIEGNVFLDDLSVGNDGHIDGVKLSTLMPNTTPRPPIYSPPLPHPQQLVSYPPRPIQYNGVNVTYMRTTPPYASVPNAYHFNISYPSSNRMNASYPAFYLPNASLPNIRHPGHIQPVHHQPSVGSIQMPVRPIQIVTKPEQTRIIQGLALKQPAAIMYEGITPIRKYVTLANDTTNLRQVDILRDQIVSLNLIKFTAFSDLVIGFIESLYSVADMQFPEQDAPHYDHIASIKSFRVLDQIDHPFPPTIYHLSVGVISNVTSVFSSVGSGEPHQLSVLPINSPNTAMFLTVANQQTLFLLISRDQTKSSQNSNQCAAGNVATTDIANYYDMPPDSYSAGEGIHVYLFHILQNSSSLSSAYFDLYQTIDLPGVVGFEKFNYHGSTYILAVCKPSDRVYLLLLRGYSGFQIVSYIHAPLVESVKVIYTVDQKPAILIQLTNGLYRVMESVII